MLITLNPARYGYFLLSISFHDLSRITIVFFPASGTKMVLGIWSWTADFFIITKFANNFFFLSTPDIGCGSGHFT